MGDVVLGQLVRQGLRSVAIYFSDLVLWLSVASLFEIALVFVAGVLCIMTAGFLFEGMKKNPVVLVLGAAVALGGTFLMFREVRGLIWPAVIDIAKQISPDLSAPLDKPGLSTGTFSCSQLSELMCKGMSSCSWNNPLNTCTNRLDPPLSGGGTAEALPLLRCSAYTRPDCERLLSCYWSVVTNSCEKLRFGAGLLSETNSPLTKDLFAPPKAGPDCYSMRSQSQCVASGCTWSFGICVQEPAVKPSAP